MEAIMHLYDLSDCSTMDEYCEKLKSWGAVYHEDVGACPEAKALDLVGEATTPASDFPVKQEKMVRSARS